MTAQIQESLVQDGGTHGTRENKTRQLVYDISDSKHPKLVHEFLLEQPGIFDPEEDKNPRATSVSELHYLSQYQYFVLARDSGHGRGSGSDTPSTYRHIDIVDTRTSTDIAQQEGIGSVAVAPEGYWLPNLSFDTYCSFININNDTDLARFGLHNGGPYAGELNEKWESLAIVPVPAGAPGAGDKEFYVISVSDNDFITQDGYYDFGNTAYADGSGLDVSTQVLVWQAHLPNYVAHG